MQGGERVRQYFALSKLTTCRSRATFAPQFDPAVRQDGKLTSTICRHRRQVFLCIRNHGSPQRPFLRVSLLHCLVSVPPTRSRPGAGLFFPTAIILPFLATARRQPAPEHDCCLHSSAQDARRARLAKAASLFCWIERTTLCTQPAAAYAGQPR